MVITAEVGEGRVTQTYRLTPGGGGGAETGIYSTRETRNTISPVQTCNQKLIREEEAGGDKRGLCKADHVAPYFFFFFQTIFFVSYTYLLRIRLCVFSFVLFCTPVIGNFCPIVIFKIFKKFLRGLNNLMPILFRILI